MTFSITQLVLGVEPGGPGRWLMNGRNVVVYYDERQARGDNGALTDDRTGEYAAWVEDRCVIRQHVSPFGGRYGNPGAKQYAADRVADAIARAVGGRGAAA
jgi:hypothetical protein